MVLLTRHKSRGGGEWDLLFHHASIGHVVEGVKDVVSSPAWQWGHSIFQLEGSRCMATAAESIQQRPCYFFSTVARYNQAFYSYDAWTSSRTHAYRLSKNNRPIGGPEWFPTAGGAAIGYNLSKCYRYLMCSRYNSILYVVPLSWERRGSPW